MGGTDGFPVAHIALADVLYSAVTVPFPLDPHEWTAAVTTAQQAGVAMTWKVAGRMFALALPELDLDFCPIFSLNNGLIEIFVAELFILRNISDTAAVLEFLPMKRRTPV